MQTTPVFLLLLLGCGPADDSGATAPEGLLPTDAGRYAMRLTPEPDPFVAGETVTLVVELFEPDGLAVVPGAEVAVTPWMPDMGHGIADPPVVTETAEGVYEAVFAFNMAGYWELTVDIDGPAGADTRVVPHDVQ